MSRKDTEKLIRGLRRQGCTVRVGGSGHWRVTGPAGVTITMPRTPNGGSRSWMNMRSNLRRLGVDLDGL
jgi:hypothetical protein